MSLYISYIIKKKIVIGFGPFFLIIYSKYHK